LTSNAACLEVRDLCVAYDRKPVLQAVSLDVQPGRLVGLIGPNGAGKSTLLMAALELVRRQRGEVKFFGQSYAKASGRVAYIPQRESVDWEFPIRAVDVVAMGLYRKIGWFRRVRGEHRARAMGALEQVGLADEVNTQIGELSGGQQQRVFLARALVQEADLFLLDEPFAGVDAETEEAVLRMLHELRDRGATAIVVHHDLTTVEANFDDVILLNRQVIAAGPTTEVFLREMLERTYGGRLLVLDAERPSRPAPSLAR